MSGTAAQNAARAFMERLVYHTEQEQTAEEEEAALLSSNCPVSLLVRRGLALTGLEVARTYIGLGGRTLVDLCRSLAHNASDVFPPHGFRPGDSIQLFDGRTKSGSNNLDKTNKGKSKAVDESLDGVVWKASDRKLVIALGEVAGDKSGPDLPQNVRIVKLSNPTTHKRQLEAVRRVIKQLEEDKLPSCLTSVLLALQPPAPRTDLASDFSFIDQTLNGSQQEAVRFCLTSQIGLVWGPPGTGKTQTLVEIIRQLHADSKRVLVCGGSNLSVDNVLQRLSIPHPACQPIPLTRLGHPARVLSALSSHTLDSQTSNSDTSELVADIKDELGALEGKLRSGAIRGSARKQSWEQVRHLRRDYVTRERGVVKEILNRARVVLGTTHGVGGRALNGQEFDVIVIDEAAQAAEPACWVPLAAFPKTARLILAGDHLQLPPTIKSLGKSAAIELSTVHSVQSALEWSSASSIVDQEAHPRLTPSATLELTLFERLLALYGNGIRRMLSISYRFNSKICAFPSRRLYNGELASDASVAAIRLSDLDNVDEDEDFDEAVVFVDTAGQAMYERAGEEGSFGAESKSNENEADICAKYVHSLLKLGVLPSNITVIAPYNAQVTLLSSILQPLGVEVGSIDGEQGRENEVVIISLVRSNMKHEVGFLAEQRRLNVAMTRARRHLVIVGDSNTVSNGSEYLKSWMEWLENESLVQVPQT